MRTKKSQRVHGSSAPPQGTRPLAEAKKGTDRTKRETIRIVFFMLIYLTTPLGLEKPVRQIFISNGLSLVEV
jgi:hypothetical protein